MLSLAREFLMNQRQKKTSAELPHPPCPVHGARVTLQSVCRYCKDPNTTKSLLREADLLLRGLWWFIENVPEDGPGRTDQFFALRCRVREYYGRSHGSQDIKDVTGQDVNFPMIGDYDLNVSKLYSMLPAEESQTEGRTAAAAK